MCLVLVNAVGIFLWKQTENNKKKLHAYSNVKTNKFEETCLKSKVPTFTEPVYLHNTMFLQDVGDHDSLEIFIY